MLWKKSGTLSNNMDVVAVALACNDDYMKYTYVLLQSILENISNDYSYEIVIMNTDISDYHKEIAFDMTRTFDNISIRFLNVSFANHLFGSLRTLRHISIETYFRLLLPDVMNEYKKVLYLDCDSIVNEDVAKLYHHNVEGYYCAAVRDLDFIACYNKPERRELYDREIMNYLNLDNHEDYFQAGVVLLNIDRIHRDYSAETIIGITKLREWFYGDQDILNYMFKGSVKYLDYKWNIFSLNGRESLLMNHLPDELLCEYKDSRKEASIVHFAGEQKPWKDKESDLAWHFWKYARKSPLYEEIVAEYNNSLPNGKIIFVSENKYEDNVGVPIFKVKLAKAKYNNESYEDYIICDFLYLSDHHINTSTAKMVMDISSFVDFGYRVNHFCFYAETNDDITIFKDVISYKIVGDTVTFYVRYKNRYEGIAWSISMLDSRDSYIPTACNITTGYIHQPIDLNEIETLYEQ